MNLNKALSKDTLTDLGAGAAGAIASVPLKDMVLSKVTQNDLFQNGLLAVGGAILHVIPKGGRAVKSFGTGMAIMGIANIVKPYLSAVLPGGDTPVTGFQDPMIGYAPDAPGKNPMIGNSDFSGASYDYTAAEAGEMDY